MYSSPAGCQRAYATTLPPPGAATATGSRPATRPQGGPSPAHPPPAAHRSSPPAPPAAPRTPPHTGAAARPHTTPPATGPRQTGPDTPPPPTPPPPPRGPHRTWPCECHRPPGQPFGPSASARRYGPGVRLRQAVVVGFLWGSWVARPQNSP